MAMKQIYTAVYKKEKSGTYVAWIEELPEANTQGKTLSETRENLRDAVRMILSYKRKKEAQKGLRREAFPLAFA